MAFLRRRRPAGGPGPERRRRSRRAPKEESSPPGLRGSSKTHRRLSWVLGAGLILVAIGVLAAGYYQEFYRPPRVWAGQVRGVEFTMGDLVQRIRVEQGLTGTVDLSTRPFDYLRRLLNAEVLRQEAPGLGIEVTEDDVEEALRSPALGFYPTVPAGQTTDPGQLDREFKNEYQKYLTRTGLSDPDFRELLEEQLRLRALFIWLGQGIPETMEQVEVEWIRLDPDGRVNPADVISRLQLEDFANVAQSVGVSAGFADPSGYVGWVPREAFPDISPLLFGDEGAGRPALPVGQIGGPVFSPEGTYIVRKLGGPESRSLSRNIRAKVNAERVEQWQDEQLERGRQEGWLKMKFSSKIYAWVAEQVNISAPRNLPEER